MKTYPGFYRNANDYLYFYLDAANYYAFANARWRKADGIDVFEHENDKNITHEYLTNTYGEVVSPEHAEFIIELAKNEGLWVYVDSPKINRAFFKFNESSGLFFYDSEEDINKGRCKKITIPLPPKADRKELSE